MPTSNYSMELMRKARAGASFDSKQLSYIIYGGTNELKNREAVISRVESLINSQDQMTLPNSYACRDRECQYQDGATCGQVLTEDQVHHDRDFKFSNHEHTVMNACPFKIRSSGFISTLRGEASEEQKKLWLPLVESGNIIGSCAQAELGHRDFLRGIETTATYDEKTDDFSINSPTTTSIKFWPCGLGLPASHAIVTARLTINSKDHGPHNFIVPIRSLHTWKCLPGIELGAIEPKMGLKSADNGYASFNAIRIPRKNMLMGLVQVQRGGTYSCKSNLMKARNEIMPLIRSQIASAVVFQLAQAVTIATRYSTVKTRDHGHYSESPVELPLMYNKLHHAPLLRLNAQAFALVFASKASTQILEDIITSPAHVQALTSGLKAYATQTAAAGAEEARRCCEGHGDSILSGLPDNVSSIAAQCSQAGDDTALYQQTAVYLMKQVWLMNQGSKDVHRTLLYIDTGPVVTANQPEAAEAENSAFLYPPSHLSGSSIPEKRQPRGAALFSSTFFLSAFRHRARRLILAASNAMATSTARERFSLGKRKAWNTHSLLLIAAAHAHIELFVLESFLARVQLIPDAKVQLVMQKQLQLFALTTILASPEFFEDGFVDMELAVAMREAVNGLHDELVPDAIALTDAWGFGGGELKSAIGVWNGNWHETLMSWIRQLNGGCERCRGEGLHGGNPERDVRPILGRGWEKSKL